ncbi:MAG: oligosaccharide flippase family protein [Bacteroidales bacterium]|nr:oligosaccharide flippase family protein [Bacteroidales bacterium]
MKIGIYKKLAGQTLIYGMGTMVPRLLNYAILTFYYTRKFSVEEYGIITELYAYVVFLLIILTYGLETGFFRYATKNKERDKVFSTLTITLFSTSVLFLVFIFLFDRNIAGLISYENNVEYIRWLAIIVAIDAFSSLPFAKLRLEERSRKFALLKVANVILTIFFVLLFYEFLPRLDKIFDLPGFLYNRNMGIGYVLLSNLFASVVVLLLLTKEIFSVKYTFDLKLLKQVLKYSLPLLIAGLAGSANESLDRVLMKQLIVDKHQALYDIGIYGANFKIAILLNLFIQMFRYAAEPFYFNYFKEKDAKMVFGNIMKYYFIIAIFMIVGILLFLDIFKYFIDSNFHEGLKIVPIVLYSYLFYGIFFNLSIWYKLTNKTKFGALFTITGAIITIAINVIFIKKYSYMAAATAHLICYITMVILSFFIGKRYYKIYYDFKRMFEYLFISFGLIFLNYLINVDILIYKLLINSVLLIVFGLYIVKRENINVKNLSVIQ